MPADLPEAQKLSAGEGATLSTRADGVSILLQASIDGPVLAIVPGLEIEGLVSVSGFVHVPHPSSPTLGFAVAGLPAGRRSASRNRLRHWATGYSFRRMDGGPPITISLGLSPASWICFWQSPRRRLAIAIRKARSGAFGSASRTTSRPELPPQAGATSSR
jgi:hypothetical protein